MLLLWHQELKRNLCFFPGHFVPHSLASNFFPSKISNYFWWFALGTSPAQAQQASRMFFCLMHFLQKNSTQFIDIWSVDLFCILDYAEKLTFVKRKWIKVGSVPSALVWTVDCKSCCWRVRSTWSKNVTVYFPLNDRPCGNYPWVLLSLKMTIWAQSTLRFSEVYYWGLQWCNYHPDGVLIFTGFIPTFPPDTFDSGQWHFDSDMCSQHNTALLTLNRDIFTLIRTEILNGHFGQYASWNSHQVLSDVNGNLFTLLLVGIVICFIVTLKISSLLQEQMSNLPFRICNVSTTHTYKYSVLTIWTILDILNNSRHSQQF